MVSSRRARRAQHIRTRIVATLGPASRSRRELRALAKAGVDVFRINFSHGNREQHRNLVREVHEARKGSEHPVALLADLQGPRIRVGRFRDAEPILLKRSESLTIVADPSVVGEPGRIGCTWPRLAKSVRPGDTILLDDGILALRVRAVDGDEVHTKVLHGGLLRPSKGINLPGTPVRTPTITAKDREDLQFALEQGVDFVALSFVRSPRDVKQLQRMIREHGSDAQVIAKIERPEAVTHLEALVEQADGIMVARGDLGVELGPAAVPPLQKRIIELCIQKARPVITATQMLESMVQNPRPTRAEASDVANAVTDGSSALMLSAETASGRHPLLTVRTMVRIARQAEELIVGGGVHPAWQRIHRRATDQHHLTISEATVTAAARAAHEVRADALVVFTETGHTARLVARERLPLQVLACTPSESTWRKLSLQWGLTPVLNQEAQDVEEMVQQTGGMLLQRGYLKQGDRVVFISGRVQVPGATNMLQIVDLGRPRKR